MIIIEYLAFYCVIMSEFTQTTQLIGSINSFFSENKINLKEISVQLRKRMKQVLQAQRTASAAVPLTLANALQATSYGPVPAVTYENETSDSESVEVEASERVHVPSLEKVAETIRLQVLQQVIPTTTIIPCTPPTSNLLIQNISFTLSLSQFTTFIKNLPIKGLVQGVTPIYYNSLPSLIVSLKTNQPHIVSAQLQMPHNQKFMRQMLGCDWKAS